MFHSKLGSYQSFYRRLFSTTSAQLLIDFIAIASSVYMCSHEIFQETERNVSWNEMKGILPFFGSLAELIFYEECWCEDYFRKYLRSL